MAFANLEDDMDCAEAYIRHAAFSPFLIALRLYALIDDGLWDGLAHWVQKTLLTGLATSRPGRRTELSEISLFRVQEQPKLRKSWTIDRLTDRQEDFLMTVLICQPFGNCYWKWWFMDRLGIVGYVSNTCNGLKLWAADHTYFCLSLPNRGTMHAGRVLGEEFFGCTWLKLRPAESDPATKASCASWSCSCFSKE